MTGDLAPYAMTDEQTQGRRFPEPRHPYRSDYQRDRDRVIHTKAFRRLEQKTQVFDPGYCDHFRNRLTHSLEVTQIARTVAGALRLNTDLCEVLALSHDIGHPPFSHDGEKALNRLMQRHGSGFDHNLHALRIVEYFEEKYVSFQGLNLTFEVREGIIKHSRDYPVGYKSYLDLGEYRLGERPPLEAQLVDLADEIAYNSADLDDGYESGLLTLDAILTHVRLFRSIYLKIEDRYPNASEKLKVSETVRSLIDTLASSLIRFTERRVRERGITTVAEVRQCLERLPAFEPEVAEWNAEMKRFLHQHLYDHSVLKKGRLDAQHVVETLFEHYLKKPETLPFSHYRRIDEQELCRVVCDYIAGMTDTFARTRYAAIGKDEG
ncbi:MAG: deoxyguanosinetriphosphate triphosphohydrolase [Acidobacteria bacterium]|nr:MAG: deoxyguanosinetriphosphate triphosphohydrolase [Acidobacteriota bacterium]